MSNGQLLDGKSLAQTLRNQLKEEIMETLESYQDAQSRQWRQSLAIQSPSPQSQPPSPQSQPPSPQSQPPSPPPPPHLVAILVGGHGPSEVYIDQKQKACLEVGINFTLYHLPKEVTEEELLAKIDEINRDPLIHGCIVQLPLPRHINEDAIIYAVAPEKDVDGFHPTNIGNLALNKPTFIPATPYGILLLLQHYHIPTEGRHVVILGKSLIVGQPLMNLLSLESGARSTVTCCDRYTNPIIQATLLKMADIVVVATGKHHLINHPDQLKPGVVVVDVGIHRIPDATKKCGYHLEGDVDFEIIKDYCHYITPVPGGVGPMTVISLLLNTWQAYKLFMENSSSSHHRSKIQKVSTTN